MINMSYTEVQNILNQSNLAKLPVLNISVFRNIMIEPIKPYLRYLAYEIGFNANLKIGEYDNVFQEAVGGTDELLSEKTDCVLIFMKLETLSWDLSRNFLALNKESILTEVERVKEYIDNTLKGIRNQTNAMILWHGFENPVYPALGILESQCFEGQQGIISRLNEHLKTKLKQIENSYFVDLNLCITRIGSNRFYDNRYWHIGRAPFSRDALSEIASENFKFIRALKGKNKKCLALDCDNTLWGGIIGEDGLAGIQLSKTHPGSSYYEFQQEILNLYNQGIIIALCSKNNEDDVWEVFRKHPDMILKEEHIVSSQINWNDKAANLKQIALDLNIGLDSIVFVDDSEFEVDLIRNILPEVEVIHIPIDKTVDRRDILVSCGLFDTLILSEEDRSRGIMYKAEASRKKLQSDVTDMKTYYRSLDMVVGIHFPDEFSIPRIAQLTQKTNQFNLTTKRYSEADIRNINNSSQSDVIYLKLSDKFGDFGIVGVCILKYRDNKAIFDTFLLSCRILGRGVEDALLIQALKLAQKKDCKSAVGEYYATRKNAQVEYFYSKCDFIEVKQNKTSEQRYFQFDLDIEIKPEPDFFKNINSDVMGDSNER
jgi:FkbH-like protein